MNTAGLFRTLSMALSLALGSALADAGTAKENPVAEVPVPDTSRQETSTGGNDLPKEDTAETAGNKPPVNPLDIRLKSTDPGAAFRSFRPSEEISADNAVPFPVDI